MNATTTYPQHPSLEDTEGSPEERSAVEISTALAELRLAGDSVHSKEWLSVEIAGEPAVSLGMLGSTASPLSALASAGCDFLTPMISFLEEPLGQLRGEPDSVSGPAGEHESAAQGAGSVAREYGSTVDKETSEWSGDAKTNYTETATKLVDGITSIAETAATNSKAMIAAGEVVAQVVDIVTRLITEAVGKIVPIMTQAIAAAPATFGASIAQAIPQCVAIAVDYGGQIAAKLAALLASGENLVKLIEGAVGVLNVVKEGLTVIGDLAGGGDSSGSSTTASEESGAHSPDSSESGSDSAPEQQGEPKPENPLDGEWTPAARA
ncbi:WXG100 family type VII secretion target [Prauserella endophytica]|uniref:WXG100 family type VII secretion target n=1 Tax=Prauserella endophytica TaxID=1592324 RepID=UPI001E394289|nr:hypothetical protein [Prauserella endophytica]